LLNERYSKRRAELEELRCERALEGVVAKKSASRYTPGERGWVKRESATPRPR
jgi:ATP-dependent DNA ligase